MIPIKDNIPVDRFPLVTFCLILANIVVYGLACAHGGSLISGPDAHELRRWGSVPAAITHPTGHTWVTVFSAMFMHASIVQIAGNMMFLWIFGHNVEDSMGPLRFLAFYGLGGLATVALQVAIEPHSSAALVGAAGPISAVMGGYVRFYPRARTLTVVLIVLFFTVIEVPTVVMLVAWFVMQAAFGLVGLIDPAGGGAAMTYLAHLAGFACGLAAMRPLARRRKPTPPTAAAA